MACEPEKSDAVIASVKNLVMLSISPGQGLINMFQKFNFNNRRLLWDGIFLDHNSLIPNGKTDFFLPKIPTATSEKIQNMF